MTTEKCKVGKCKGSIRAKGYCERHYKQWRRGELPKPRFKTCKSEGCKKAMLAQGYCKDHFESWKSSRKNAVRKVKDLEKKTKKAEAAAVPAPVAAAPEAAPAA